MMVSLAQPESYPQPGAGNAVCKQNVGAGAGEGMWADDRSSTKVPKYDIVHTWRASSGPEGIIQSTATCCVMTFPSTLTTYVTVALYDYKRAAKLMASGDVGRRCEHNSLLRVCGDAGVSRHHVEAQCLAQ